MTLRVQPADPHGPAELVRVALVDAVGPYCARLSNLLNELRGGYVDASRAVIIALHGTRTMGQHMQMLSTLVGAVPAAAVLPAPAAVPAPAALQAPAAAVLPAALQAPARLPAPAAAVLPALQPPAPAVLAGPVGARSRLGSAGSHAGACSGGAGGSTSCYQPVRASLHLRPQARAANAKTEGCPRSASGGDRAE